MPRYPFFPIPELESVWFDALLNSSLTSRVIHRPARLCPCQDERSAGPDPKCPVCDGLGYTWAGIVLAVYSETLTRYGANPYWGLDQNAPAERLERSGAQVLSVVDEDGVSYAGVTVDEESRPVFGPLAPRMGKRYTISYQAPVQGRLHAQSITTRRVWQGRGETQAGDLQASIPAKLADLITPNPAWAAKEHDRFVFPDLERTYQQRMRRGLKETLTYPTLRRVVSCRAVVAGGEVEYAEGDDFLIQGGKVEWQPGRGPAMRTPYILEYVAAPEYYVFEEIPQMRHTDGYDLPRRVGLRLFDAYPGRGR